MLRYVTQSLFSNYTELHVKVKQETLLKRISVCLSPASGQASL